MRHTIALILALSLPAHSLAAQCAAGEFLTNPTCTLPGPKVDAKPVPSGADVNKVLRASDFNALRNALNDARTDSSALPVTASGSTTARSLRDRAADTLHVKDFGCVGDGIADDTACLQAAFAAFATSSAGTLDFGRGTYLVPSLSDNAALGTFTGATKKRFIGQGAILRTTQFAVGNVVSATAWDGTKFTITTATPHGYTTGQLVGVYNATPIQMNGYYTATVLNATQFTYVPTVAPTGFVFVAATTQATNYGISFLKFLTGCKDITITGLRFEGSVLSNAVQSRLGWIGVYALHGERFTVDITTQGLAYGVLFEMTDTANVRVIGNNTGYGVAYSKVSAAQTFVNMDTTHRSAYLAGVSNSRVAVLSKNHDVMAALITSYDEGGGVHAPSKNLAVEYTDTGTSLPESRGQASVVGVGVYGYDGAAAPVNFDNISVRFSVIETVNGISIRPFVMNTFGNYVYSGLSISGYHDKTIQASANRTLEFLTSIAPAWDTAIVRGVNLHDIEIRNPAVYTASRFWFSNLAGDVRFTNVAGEAIDPAWVSINSGSGVLRKTTADLVGGVVDFGAPVKGAATAGRGLEGVATTGIGVKGSTQGSSASGAAVLGENTGTGASSYGLYGSSSSNAAGNVGVFGSYNGTDGGSSAVLGQALNGYGVRAITTSVGIPFQARQDGATTSRTVAEIHRASGSTGTGPIIQLWDESSGGTAPLAEFKGTSAASAAKNISTWKTGAVLDGYVQVMVNGAVKWMPDYTAPTGP
jgi:hypothetical protein